MDALGEKLAMLLRQNGCRSVSGIAATLNISRATVRARLERMEKAGDIIGYTVILRADAVEQKIRGIMLIEIEGHAAERVIRALGGYPEVSAIHTTNGRWDLVVEMGTARLTEFDDVLRRIRLIPGITGSETNLLLATPRTTRARLG